MRKAYEPHVQVEDWSSFQSAGYLICANQPALILAVLNLGSQVYSLDAANSMDIPFSGHMTQIQAVYRFPDEYSLLLFFFTTPGLVFLILTITKNLCTKPALAIESLQLKTKIRAIQGEPLNQAHSQV